MCGIVGIYHKDKSVAGEIYDGLIQVQHRGQDAAGICTLDKKHMSLYKDLGVVTEVFKTENSLKMQLRTQCPHLKYFVMSRPLQLLQE